MESQESPPPPPTCWKSSSYKSVGYLYTNPCWEIDSWSVSCNRLLDVSYEVADIPIAGNFHSILNLPSLLLSTLANTTFASCLTSKCRRSLRHLRLQVDFEDQERRVLPVRSQPNRRRTKDFLNHLHGRVSNQPHLPLTDRLFLLLRPLEMGLDRISLIVRRLRCRRMAHMLLHLRRNLCLRHCITNDQHLLVTCHHHHHHVLLPVLLYRRLRQLVLPQRSTGIIEGRLLGWQDLLQCRL